MSCGGKLNTCNFSFEQVGHKFGHQVEAFFVILTALQFHMLFYCTRALPNILALAVGDHFSRFYFVSAPFVYMP